MFCSHCGHKFNREDKFCPKCGQKIGGQVEKSDIKELKICRILGIILLLSSLPVSLFFAFATAGRSLLSIMTIVVIFSLYLLVSKKYHLVSDIFFVLVALIAYTVKAPIFLFFGYPPIAPLVALKTFILTADWTNSGFGVAMGDTRLYLYLSVLNMLFITTALFLLATNIFSRTKVIAGSSKRSRICAFTFIIIATIIFTLPWLHKVQVANSSGAGGPPPNSGTVLNSMGPDIHNTVEFDSEKGIWTYQIQLVNTSHDLAEITAIKAKTLSGKTVQVAPPFDKNIEITGGQKLNDKITVGVTPAILKISSGTPLILIGWFESNNKFGGEVEFSQ
jgi:DNA-directed RNA polymerase subunit RPC12/RpoP